MRLSLLPTSHPLGFQPKWVRSSTRYNPRFNLLMGSSRSFGSATNDSIRPIQTRFPFGSGPEGLNQPRTATRRIIMQKARRHTLLPGCPGCHSAPTACRHMVSGSYPSPCRGSFHLSVALLGSLSVVREYLALRDGPRRFSRGST